MIASEPRHHLRYESSRRRDLVGLAFAVFYATLGMPIAMLADRSNRRNIIAISITLWSAMTVVCAFVTSFPQMAMARIGVAIGESGSSPASNSIISELFGPQNRATATSLFVVGANVGVLVAYLAGGFILDEWGWRTAFIAVGLPGVLIAILFLVTVKEPDRGRLLRASGAAASGPDVKDSDARSSGKDVPGFWQVVRLMFSQPTLRHITIAQSLAGFVGYGFSLWIPSFLFRSHEMTPTQVGLSMALAVGLAGAIGTLLSGRIVDSLASLDLRWRVWAVALSQLIPIPFVIAFLHLGNPVPAIVAYVVPAILSVFYLAPSFALVQGLVEPRMRAVAAAISMFMINMIGMGLGPQGVGSVSDLLTPQFGDDSLRWALTAFLFVNVWCAFHVWWAGRTILDHAEAA